MYTKTFKLFNAPAEGQCAKVLVDGPQQGLGTWQAQRHMPHIKVLHVVGALQVLTHIALASAAQAGTQAGKAGRQAGRQASGQAGTQQADECLVWRFLNSS
jgi:hypothetical protein